MLQSAKKLRGYTIRATDGDMGKIDELYFQEDSWVVRYLVVDVGNWLTSERVLLIPAAIEDVDREEKTLSVSLTREQVKDSPDIDTQKPVSREKEIALHEHYAWAPYWTYDPIGPPALGPASAKPTAPRMPVDTPTQEEQEAIRTAVQTEDEGDVKLRSSDEVAGYDIQANDGEIGHVEDFIVDTGTWIIRYLVIDTRDWLPGKDVLVSPAWVTAIHWADAEVYVDLVRESVKNSPKYDPDKLISREYEAELHEHYQKPTYWQE